MAIGVPPRAHRSEIHQLARFGRILGEKLNCSSPGTLGIESPGGSNLYGLHAGKCAGDNSEARSEISNVLREGSPSWNRTQKPLCIFSLTLHPLERPSSVCRTVYLLSDLWLNPATAHGEKK
jgi:hypothetical protein